MYIIHIFDVLNLEYTSISSSSFIQSKTHCGIWTSIQYWVVLATDKIAFNMTNLLLLYVFLTIINIYNPYYQAKHLPNNLQVSHHLSLNSYIILFNINFYWATILHNFDEGIAHGITIVCSIYFALFHWQVKVITQTPKK